MTDQPLQGGGVFEITDYTTASDWERFIANLEEVLTEWELHKQSNSSIPYTELPERYLSRGIWREKHDSIKYGNFTFDIRYQYLDDSNLNPTSSDKDKISSMNLRSESRDSESLSEYEDAKTNELDESLEDSNSSLSEDFKSQMPTKEEREHGEHELPDNAPECILDLISNSNDFASKAHCLVRWYNVRKFIILIPKGDTIISEDRVKQVLSSASIAVFNVDCHIPIFIQTHNPTNHFYQGISEHHNIRTMYEMVFFKKSLNKYSFLSELLTIFREKTSCNLSDPTTVTARLNYCLDIFELFIPPSEEFNGNEHSDDEQGSDIKIPPVKNKSNRPQDMRSVSTTFEQVIEALEDCLPHPYKILKYIHVAAIWPPVSDKVISESPVQSDLDPAEAPIWTMRCVTGDNCNMKIVHETQAVYELLTAAVDYAYDKMNAETAFTEYTRESLKERCLKLSYELATQPEVVLSESPTDSLRKLIALLFFRASELRADSDPLDQIANQLKKRPPFNEIYRNFYKMQKPSVKEFIIRSQISRPFTPISTPALPQRMFCTVCDGEFRLCGAFSELCN